MTISHATSTLLERIRKYGSCPPSLIKADGVSVHDGFDDTVLSVLESESISIMSDVRAADTFGSLLKLAQNDDSLQSGLDTQQKRHVLIQRRAILLSILGSTSSSNVALRTVLTNGALFMIKSWLSDITRKLVGGVDLLLHLLTNITHLPVTKEMVAESKLGKAVVAVLGHSICAGGPNENAIKERVTLFKEEWSASVKHQLKHAKEEDYVPRNMPSLKRNAPSNSDPGGKKIKVEAGRNIMSTSHLLTSVQSMEGHPPVSAAENARLTAKDHNQNTRTTTALNNREIAPGSERTKESEEKNQIEKPDSSGKNLFVYHDREVSVEEQELLKEKGDVSWTDRKNSDHMREKEMFDKARKSKVVDKQAKLDAMGSTHPPLVLWRKPQPLKNTNSVQVTSNELAKQVSRMASVAPAEYLSEDTVPNNPTALSDIEQALDMTSQASSSQESIPFFAPQQEKEAPPTVVPASIPIQAQQPMVSPNISAVMAASNLVPPPPPPRAVQSSFPGATMEVVQAMGLPLFLVGQNVQALQTLAATPNLLNTFVDTNGLYDQVRLLNLVQTLTQNLTPTQAMSQASQVQPPLVNLAQSHYMNQQYQQPQQQQPNTLLYQPQGVVPPPPPFQQTPSTGGYLPQPSSYSNSSNRSNQNNGRKMNGSGAGYRGDQNGSEANLHISGYGPGTTQADIMALFAPYVHAVEVVTKNNFSFVNTRDPSGAKCAREALNGAILGGRPVRINIATRRAPDLESGGRGGTPGDEMRPMDSNPMQGSVPLPRNALGQIDYEQVTDDRGNPATKNLFVAGYGSGTTEQELRAIFGQHCQVSGAVMKGSFAFINTTDKVSAVHAREALTGASVNGAPLRINFAKESGRLGTSFDQTYGPASRSPYMRGHDR